MYMGNAMLLVLNLPDPPLGQDLEVPYHPLPADSGLLPHRRLQPDFSQLEITLMIPSVLGYLMRKYKFEMPPLILALVLGPMMESSLRLSLLMSQGDPTTFLRRPLSALFMIVSTLLIVLAMLPGIQKKRAKLKEKLGDDEI
jgi:TctA family transporter